MIEVGSSWRMTMVALALVSACSSTPPTDDPSVAEQPSGAVSGASPEAPLADRAASSGAPADEGGSSAGASEDPVPQFEAPKPGVISAENEAAIDRALRLAEQGDPEEAAAALKRLADAPQGGYLASYNLGVLQEQRGKYEEAAGSYLAALRAEPDFSPALGNLLRTYLRLGRMSDAERIANEFQDLRPENMNHRAYSLLIPIQKGAYEDVVRGAKLVLRKDETNVEAMYALARGNFMLERFELARAVIERAVGLQPDRAELYNFYGMIQLKLENKPSALANFRKALELRNDLPDAHNNLGVLYHEARDYEAAAREFEEAVKYFPGYKEAYLNLGNAYKGMQRAKDAELAFQKALGLDGSYHDARFNLGVLYLDSEIEGMEKIPRLQKAIAELQKYVETNRRMAKNDPANKYIQEARNAIEVEKQRQEMLREDPMPAEPTDDADGMEEGIEGGADDTGAVDESEASDATDGEPVEDPVVEDEEIAADAAVDGSSE